MPYILKAIKMIKLEFPTKHLHKPKNSKETCNEGVCEIAEGPTIKNPTAMWKK